MLKFAVVTAVGTLCATGAAKALISYDAPVAPAAAVQAAGAASAEQLRRLPPAGQPPVVAVARASSDTSVTKSADGHFWAEGVVNGERVRFLVDTGASAVALTPADAQRLGFTPADLDFRYSVDTANGKARAARVKLASVAVAGARVQAVDAFVMESGLSTSLLGMTYLGRLSRFEATPSTLILRS